jgi:hypothetical protein
MIDLPKFHQTLIANVQELKAFLEPLSSGQLEFKRENEWNMLEIAEHILLTEKLVMSLLSQETTTRVEQPELFGTEKLKRFLVDFRHKKVKAPDSIVPKGILADPQQFVTELSQLRAQLVYDIQTGKLAITHATYKHPMLGEMTVTDWLYFIVHHSERHFHQMKDRLAEMRAS